LRELKNRVKGIFGCAQMRSDELYVPDASISCGYFGFPLKNQNGKILGRCILF
jgi:hypothetical protein